ncbi:hypothetical protein FV232_04640 [Methylobacterium sp. WL30]|uniref:hypothetical protein n=1 Tax=unclassified Methylobacterium TaxID=2615210 RepID=UPI0011CA39F5|nr:MULTISPECIES: hypothetical protein [unclassified Methylobacterium]TXN41542.1 hypothetical protein FV225_02045 [Methylobacterium sp. WL93]TXN52450.1 hypothetical protein FV227_03140 [Methylobacterium sp. WL119]TXN69747.1 hypothetical protein FV232_04640 [Methylobacterium sp. WL30]
MSSPFDTSTWLESFDALGSSGMHLEGRVWGYLHGLMTIEPLTAPTSIVIVADPHTARWRVSSAWQKSIRRGYVAQACLYARTYVSLDLEAFWRRLPVIAIEDIGIANPTLVFAIMWIAGKKAKRASLATEMQWADRLTALMAQSVKDRTCCDLVVCAESDPDLAGFRARAFSSDKPGGLSVYVRDPENYLVKRLIALWALGGTKRYRGGGDLPEKQAGHDLEFDAYLTEQPFPHRWMAMQGGNKTQDAMPLAWGLLHANAVAAGDTCLVEGKPMLHLKIHETALPSHTMIHGLPSYALDMHTGLGKKALGFMAAKCNPIRQFLEYDCGITDYEAKRDTLGGIMFRVDSALLDRRLEFSDSEAVYDLCETARWRYRGIPIEMLDKARELATANLPWLDYARRHVAGLTSPSEKPPVPTFVGPITHPKWVA